MTTIAPVTVEWIRLTIGGEQVELIPSPGIEPRLLVDQVPYDGCDHALLRAVASETWFTVDLMLPPVDGDPWLVEQRCRDEARRAAEALGAFKPIGALVRDFALEAGLGGVKLPYNRVFAPHLVLKAETPHEIEDRDERGIRVFTAVARPDAGGNTHQLRLAD
ncbi:hypothetical protein [Streptomyces sp. SAS_275]|uniref:hypothetical protein n=1 Tax=Streptomyces sp. SAS_275 TaxID=3412746 RepID=UPI00403C0761